MDQSNMSQEAHQIKQRIRSLGLSYAQQALDDLEQLPVTTDPKSAASRAEVWGEVFDTLRKISDQIDRTG